MFQSAPSQTSFPVVCLNFYERVEQTIECVRSFTPSNAKIYIFNPGCSRKSREILGNFCNQFKQVTIIDSDVNLGISAGRNTLINHTKEEWLLFVDNDIKAKTPDWVERFRRHRALHPGTEVFIPQIFNMHEDKYLNPVQLAVNGKRVVYEQESKDTTRSVFPGAAFFVDRKLFARLGLFDEKLFAFEDFELCLRGILTGKPVKAFWVHDIEFSHKHEAARNQRDQAAARVRYSYDRIETSYERIVKKHGIALPNDWRQWVASQRELVLGQDCDLPSESKQIA